VVLTEEMKRNVESLFPMKPVYFIRNPVNVTTMTNPAAFVRDRNRLLYLGWYTKEKGVYDLVDAVKILRKNGNELKLDFYGTKKVDALRRYVKRQRLGEAVTVNEWIDNHRKLEALYKCAALVLPSHTEGIPNVILEAMATKTPIISTDVGGLKEVLQDGFNAVIAQPRNPVDLSEKIRRCLDNEALMARITENGYKEVKHKYDLEVIIKQFAGIMEHVWHDAV
jgi:glycosyltransferase involved in cell wall biosynthesis